MIGRAIESETLFSRQLSNDEATEIGLSHSHIGSFNQIFDVQHPVGRILLCAGVGVEKYI
jgi:hypothetical protein